MATVNKSTGPIGSQQEVSTYSADDSGLSTWPFVAGSLGAWSVVRLRRNQLRTLGPLPPSTAVLDVTGCLISSVAQDASADGLVSLTMADNRMVNLTRLSIGRRLVHLDLSNNFITSAVTLPALSPLRYVNLSGNCISSFELQAGFASLQVLDLQRNQLSTAPKIDNFRALRVLLLDEQRIDSLDAAGFTSSSLSAVRLRDNQLTSAVLAGSSSPLRSVSILDVDGNRLRSLRQLTDSFPSVVHLSVRRNKLSFPKAGGSAGVIDSNSDSEPLIVPSLQTLRVCFNAIEDINALRGCRHLQRLYASHCGLRSIPFVPEWGASLQVLDLSYNRIRDDGLAGLQTFRSLIALRLRGNLIRSVDSVLQYCNQGGMPYLLELDLRDNPCWTAASEGIELDGSSANSTSLAASFASAANRSTTSVLRGANATNGGVVVVDDTPLFCITSNAAASLVLSATAAENTASLSRANSSAIDASTGSQLPLSDLTHTSGSLSSSGMTSWKHLITFPPTVDAANGQASSGLPAIDGLESADTIRGRARAASQADVNGTPEYSGSLRSYRNAVIRAAAPGLVLLDASVVSATERKATAAPAIVQRRVDSPVLEDASVTRQLEYTVRADATQQQPASPAAKGKGPSRAGSSTKVAVTDVLRDDDGETGISAILPVPVSPAPPDVPAASRGQQQKRGGGTIPSPATSASTGNLELAAHSATADATRQRSSSPSLRSPLPVVASLRSPKMSVSGVDRWMASRGRHHPQGTLASPSPRPSSSSSSVRTDSLTSPSGGGREIGRRTHGFPATKPTTATTSAAAAAPASMLSPARSAGSDMASTFDTARSPINIARAGTATSASYNPAPVQSTPARAAPLEIASPAGKHPATGRGRSSSRRKGVASSHPGSSSAMLQENEAAPASSSSSSALHRHINETSSRQKQHQSSTSTAPGSLAAFWSSRKSASKSRSRLHANGEVHVAGSHEAYNDGDMSEQGESTPTRFKTTSVSAAARSPSGAHSAVRSTHAGGDQQSYTQLASRRTSVSPSLRRNGGSRRASFDAQTISSQRHHAVAAFSAGGNVDAEIGNREPWETTLRPWLGKEMDPHSRVFSSSRGGSGSGGVYAEKPTHATAVDDVMHVAAGVSRNRRGSIFTAAGVDVDEFQHPQQLAQRSASNSNAASSAQSSADATSLRSPAGRAHSRRMSTSSDRAAGMTSAELGARSVSRSRSRSPAAELMGNGHEGAVDASERHARDDRGFGEYPQADSLSNSPASSRSPSMRGRRSSTTRARSPQATDSIHSIMNLEHLTGVNSTSNVHRNSNSTRARSPASKVKDWDLAGNGVALIFKSYAYTAAGEETSGRDGRDSRRSSESTSRPAHALAVPSSSVQQDKPRRLGADFSIVAHDEEEEGADVQVDASQLPPAGAPSQTDLSAEERHQQAASYIALFSPPRHDGQVPVLAQAAPQPEAAELQPIARPQLHHPRFGASSAARPASPPSLGSRSWPLTGAGVASGSPRLQAAGPAPIADAEEDVGFAVHHAMHDVASEDDQAQQNQQANAAGNLSRVPSLDRDSLVSLQQVQLSNVRKPSPRPSIYDSPDRSTPLASATATGAGETPRIRSPAVVAASRAGTSNTGNTTGAVDRGAARRSLLGRDDDDMMMMTGARVGGASASGRLSGSTVDGVAASGRVSAGKATTLDMYKAAKAAAAAGVAPALQSGSSASSGHGSAEDVIAPGRGRFTTAKAATASRASNIATDDDSDSSSNAPAASQKNVQAPAMSAADVASLVHTLLDREKLAQKQQPPLPQDLNSTASVTAPMLFRQDSLSQNSGVPGSATTRSPPKRQPSVRAIGTGTGTDTDVDTDGTEVTTEPAVKPRRNAQGVSIGTQASLFLDSGIQASESDQPLTARSGNVAYAGVDEAHTGRSSDADQGAGSRSAAASELLAAAYELRAAALVLTSSSSPATERHVPEGPHAASPGSTMRTADLSVGGRGAGSGHFDAHLHSRGRRDSVGSAASAARPSQIGYGSVYGDVLQRERAKLAQKLVQSKENSGEDAERQTIELGGLVVRALQNATDRLEAAVVDAERKREMEQQQQQQAAAAAAEEEERRRLLREQQQQQYQESQTLPSTMSPSQSSKRSTSVGRGGGAGAHRHVGGSRHACEACMAAAAAATGQGATVITSSEASGYAQASISRGRSRHAADDRETAERRSGPAVFASPTRRSSIVAGIMVPNAHSAAEADADAARETFRRQAAGGNSRSASPPARSTAGHVYRSGRAAEEAQHVVSSSLRSGSSVGDTARSPSRSGSVSRSHSRGGHGRRASRGSVAAMSIGSGGGAGSVRPPWIPGGSSAAASSKSAHVHHVTAAISSMSAHSGRDRAVSTAQQRADASNARPAPNEHGTGSSNVHMRRSSIQSIPIMSPAHSSYPAQGRPGSVNGASSVSYGHRYQEQQDENGGVVSISLPEDNPQRLPIATAGRAAYHMAKAVVATQSHTVIGRLGLYQRPTVSFYDNDRLHEPGHSEAAHQDYAAADESVQRERRHQAQSASSSRSRVPQQVLGPAHERILRSLSPSNSVRSSGTSRTGGNSQGGLFSANSAVWTAAASVDYNFGASAASLSSPSSYVHRGGQPPAWHQQHSAASRSRPRGAVSGGALAPAAGRTNTYATVSGGPQDRTWAGDGGRAGAGADYHDASGSFFVAATNAAGYRHERRASPSVATGSTRGYVQNAAVMPAEPVRAPSPPVPAVANRMASSAGGPAFQQQQLDVPTAQQPILGANRQPFSIPSSRTGLTPALGRQVSAILEDIDQAVKRLKFNAAEL